MADIGIIPSVTDIATHKFVLHCESGAQAAL